jgi:hypothetical protein
MTAVKVSFVGSFQHTCIYAWQHRTCRTRTVARTISQSSTPNFLDEVRIIPREILYGLQRCLSRLHTKRKGAVPMGTYRRAAMSSSPTGYNVHVSMARFWLKEGISNGGILAFGFSQWLSV